MVETKDIGGVNYMVFSPHIARKIAQESVRKLADAEVARQAAKKTSKVHRRSTNQNQPLSNSSKVKVGRIRDESKRLGVERKKISDKQKEVEGYKLAAKVFKKDKTKWTKKDFKFAHGFLGKLRQPGFDYSDSGINLGPKTNITDEELIEAGYTYYKGKKLNPKKDRHIFAISESELVDRKIIPEEKVAFSSPVKHGFTNAYGPFEVRQINKEQMFGKPKGVTFWKKNIDGSTFRNSVEKTKRLPEGGKIGEQTYALSNALKWRGIGLGLGGAGVLGGGGLAYSGDNTKKRPGTPNYGNYFG